MTVLRKGQRWLLHNHTMETVTEYELVSYGVGFYGPTARLRNVENDELAHIFCKWLHEEETRKGRSSYWTPINPAAEVAEAAAS